MKVRQNLFYKQCIHWIVSIWSGNALGWKRPASAMQFAAPGTSWMLQPVFSAEWLGVIIGVTGVTRLELLQGKGWQRQLYKKTEVAEVLDRLIFHHFLFRDGIWLGHIATLPLKSQHLCHIDAPWLLPRAAKAFYKALAAGKGVVDSHAIAQSSVRHSANVGIRHEAVPRTSDDVAQFPSWRL